MHHRTPPPDALPDGPRSRRGRETVLVVGERLVRDATTLEALGYRIVRVADPRAALAAVERDPAGIDLLFAPAGPTPGMTGEELAARARHASPGIALLLAGPRALAAPGADVPAAGIEYLEDGLPPDDLALRVRHVLGNQLQVNALAKVLGQSARARDPDAQEPRWRVLLVEDQDEVRDTSRQLLELLGCDVQAVRDAEAADAALQRNAFDVMLTDIMLPGRSGLELARAAARRQPALRIVVSSGHGRSASRVAGVRTWTLPKPYGVRELEALLGEFART